jgi:hypothetical protein
LIAGISHKAEEKERESLVILAAMMNPPGTTMSRRVTGAIQEKLPDLFALL